MAPSARSGRASGRSAGRREWCCRTPRRSHRRKSSPADWPPPVLRQKSIGPLSLLILPRLAGHDNPVLATILWIARALALACRGHHELVLENLALRQQLHALTRTRTRPVL